MTTTLHAWMTRCSTWIGQHPFAATLLFFFGIGLLLLWAPAQRVTPPRPAVNVSPLEPGELDRALVTRYETRFDALQAQVHQQQQQWEARDAAQRKANEALQQQMEHGLAELRQLLSTRQTPTTQPDTAAAAPIPSFRHVAPQHQQHRAAPPHPQQTLEVSARTEESETDRHTVQLPAGSFAPSTILTGAYAPADQERPLPVLIRVNAGFTGPNHTRVPLQACFVIGK